MTKFAKHDVIGQYNLPKKVEWCRVCTNSNQRPRLTFSSDNVCGACQWKRKQNREVDWAAREKALAALCNKHRKGNGEFDVLVPCSGGKDSGLAAHLLKSKYGMTPLTVTWAPHLYTEIGRKNLTALIDHGFHNIMGTGNGLVHRKLTRAAFIHGGHPFLPFVYGQINFPLQQAINYNIPLVFYGESGAEYGDMKNSELPTRELADVDVHTFGGYPLSFWLEHGIERKDIIPYQQPPMDSIKRVGLEVHFLGYYINWDPQENFYYAVENTGFIPNPDRTEGTYSKYASLDDKLDGFHYYMRYIKFGMGRAVADSAHEVRVGKITRSEGVALVKKFDGEFPRKHFKDFLEYIAITEDEFVQVVDSWRSDHLWTKAGGEWKLRFPLWDANVEEGDHTISAKPI